MSLEASIRDVTNRFCRTGSVNKGNSLGRHSVSEEVVDDSGGIRKHLCQDCLSSQEFLVQHEIEQWVESTDERILQNIFEIRKKETCALNKNDEHFQDLL